MQMSDIVDFTSTSAKNEPSTLTSTTQMESSKNYVNMSNKVCVLILTVTFLESSNMMTAIYLYCLLMNVANDSIS